MTQRPFNPWPCVIAATVLIGLTVNSMLRPPEPIDKLVIKGNTMGTSYRIVIGNAPLTNKEVGELKGAIAARLTSLNKALSTYDVESDISKLNHLEAGNSLTNASSDLLNVLTASQTIHEQSDHAFDPTLSPIIDLWGFGSPGTTTTAPSENDITEALNRLGTPSLKIRNDNAILKSQAGVELNLSALAKGYAVDELCTLIQASGCSNALVEIGGELRGVGSRPGTNHWAIGIQTPNRNGDTPISWVVSLKERAIATSGDYRNYFEEGGLFFSHILDPRTGQPVTNHLASVSVVTTNCMFADALATSLMVLGEEAGITWINTLPDTEALVIVRKPSGVYTTHLSDGMGALISK